MKEEIKEIIENNYIEDSPDLILELFKQEREKLLKRIKLEFKALPNGFFKGVSATETQLYLNIRGEIIKEAIFNLEKLKSQLKDEK